MASPSESGNKGPGILDSMWALTALATVFLAGRLFVRLKILKMAGVDDFLITLSLCFGYVYCALTTIAVNSGFGKHEDTLNMTELEGAMKWSIAGYTPGVLSFVLPKLGVVWLLIKLLNPSRRQRITLWVMVGAAAISIIICVAILFAQCQPSRALWTPTITDYTCWSPWVLVDYAIFAGSFSAFVDLYLAAYPATVLWKLQMNIKRKLGLTIALGLGTCACVVAIYKCTRLPSLADSDYTYATADLLLWTSIESNTIIMAACIPTLAPLVDLVLGKRALGSNKATGSYQKYGNSNSNPSRQRHTSGFELSNNYSQNDNGAREGSQENILYPGKIHVTQEIAIERDGRARSELSTQRNSISDTS